jgi:hypothetical protein
MRSTLFAPADNASKNIKLLFVSANHWNSDAGLATGPRAEKMLQKNYFFRATRT